MSASEMQPVIGLEIHAQLATESKIFCGCANSYGQPPNSVTCPVCLGLPGALPVLNETAVRLAAQVIVAFGGMVAERSAFARKNYFYPDLPKGYQITQYDRPLGTGGEVAYVGESGQWQSCRLQRIHLEEDAGKLLHDASHETKVDYNRCGAPLAEIVTEPELASPQAAASVVRSIRQALRYLDVCDGDMEKGQLRCDANISIRQPDGTLSANRTEVKNLNSFKAIERALQAEMERQRSLVASGQTVEQATLYYDERTGEVGTMRTKEQAPDYRYFPEPDIPELVVDERWLWEVTQDLPLLPRDRERQMSRLFGIRDYDCRVLCAERALANYAERVMERARDSQAAANWLSNVLLAEVEIGRGELDPIGIPPDYIAHLVDAVTAGEVSNAGAREVLAEMLSASRSGRRVESPERVIDRLRLAVIDSEKELLRVVETVIEAHPEQVALYHRGKAALFTFFVGQVMAATKGRADVQLARRLLEQRLNEEEK